MRRTPTIHDISDGEYCVPRIGDIIRHRTPAYYRTYYPSRVHVGCHGGVGDTSIYVVRDYVRRACPLGNGQLIWTYDCGVEGNWTWSEWDSHDLEYEDVLVRTYVTDLDGKEIGSLEEVEEQANNMADVNAFPLPAR